MTLQVPFEQFANAAKRVLGAREAFVVGHRQGSLVTASSSTARAVVASISTISPDAAKAQLRVAGFETFDGVWSTEGLAELAEDPAASAFVAAVAYVSGEGRPGIWVDAFAESPSQVQVLKALYDEFRLTGEVAEVPFEEFVRLTNANVVIISPTQLRSYIVRKVPCPPTEG